MQTSQRGFVIQFIYSKLLALRLIELICRQRVEKHSNPFGEAMNDDLGSSLKSERCMQLWSLYVPLETLWLKTGACCTESIHVAQYINLLLLTGIAGTPPLWVLCQSLFECQWCARAKTDHHLLSKADLAFGLKILCNVQLMLKAQLDSAQHSTVRRALSADQCKMSHSLCKREIR